MATDNRPAVSDSPVAGGYYAGNAMGAEWPGSPGGGGYKMTDSDHRRGDTTISGLDWGRVGDFRELLHAVLAKR